MYAMAMLPKGGGCGGGGVGVGGGGWRGLEARPTTHTFHFLHDSGVGLLVEASFWLLLISAHHCGFIVLVTVL